MTTLTTGSHGQLALPEAVRTRYSLEPGTPIRIIETRHGILLVPLADAPMTEELASELAQWQSLSAETWDLFPYEDEA